MKRVMVLVLFIIDCYTVISGTTFEHERPNDRGQVKWLGTVSKDSTPK